MENKVKAGFVSTYPPTVSGLSRYADELCDSINSMNCGVTAEKLSIDRESRYAGFSYLSAAGCDVIIYNLGNHPMNAAAYRAALKNPSICVLHEFELSSLGRRIIGRDPLKMLIGRGNLFVTHTEANLRRLREMGGRGFHIREFAFSSPSSVKIQDGGYVGVFGFVSRSKGAGEILDGYEEYLKSGGGMKLLFGGNEADFPLREEIEKRRISAHVEFAENPSDEEYDSLLASCSAGINLRLTESGETSANMLRLFSLGKPVAMNRTVSADEDYKGCYFEIRRESIREDIAGFFRSVEQKSERLGKTAERALAVSSEKNSLGRAAAEWVRLLSNPSLKAGIRRAKAEGKKRFFIRGER